MRRDQTTTVDLMQPRTVADILATALSLYGRYPLVFLLLALAVFGPYDLIVLAVTNSSPLGQQSADASTVLILNLVAFAVAGPLVSALQMQALVNIGAGERPRLLDVMVRGLKVLPVVVAAEIIAGLGIGVGLLLFIVPGIFLALRWAVVAQVAAVEQTNWPGALRRAAALAAGNYWRIIAVFISVSLIDYLLIRLGAQIAGTKAHVGQVALGIAIDTLTQSFRALATAVLYFDLCARHQA